MRGIVKPIMQGINGLTVLIVIWYGGIRVMRGDLLVADIVAFIAYLNVLAWPTAAFGWMFSLVERGRAAMNRLEEILETNPEIADEAASPAIHALKEGMEFRDVSFAYERQKNGHWALEGIDFTLPVGRSVGLVGRVGSGKSTLAQLVPRMFDVSSGAILVDGQDVVSWRCAICADDRLCAPGPVFFLHLAKGESCLRPGKLFRGRTRPRRRDR